VKEGIALFSGEGDLRADATEAERVALGHASTANAERDNSRASGNGPIPQEQFEADARKLLVENGRPMKEDN
jgi:hypothetical protein